MPPPGLKGDANGYSNGKVISAAGVVASKAEVSTPVAGNKSCDSVFATEFDGACLDKSGGLDPSSLGATHLVLHNEYLLSELTDALRNYYAGLCWRQRGGRVQDGQEREPEG